MARNKMKSTPFRMLGSNTVTQNRIARAILVEWTVEILRPLSKVHFIPCQKTWKKL